MTGQGRVCVKQFAQIPNCFRIPSPCLPKPGDPGSDRVRQPGRGPGTQQRLRDSLQHGGGAPTGASGSWGSGSPCDLCHSPEVTRKR